MRSGAVAISEKAFLGQIVELARYCGWAEFHPWLSIRSAAGWPDLALCRPPRLILAEVKSERGKVTMGQAAWLEMLRQVPCLEVKLWRPSDWDDIEATLTAA